ncbi:transposase [Sessilibacter corallicola]|uniref:IS1182-like element ISMac2 family transposase n=1 Tax=Sessilibacter corallicola TaxID=2904075 RepID=A0ABQ0AF96_9GAMM
MPKFKSYDYNQDIMVVINFKEQLQAGTFEYALHYLIDNKLDLSVFYPNYQNDTESGGRPAYDPAILLKIILFAYSKGITSSREIEWCCSTNIIFKALSCDTIPHFTTIANFVSCFPQEMAEIFSQVIVICQEEGLIGYELFAIDGCKMSSNAAKEHSGIFKELVSKRDKIKQQIEHHIKQQTKMDEYNVLEEGRKERIEKTINTLNKAFDKYDKFLKTHTPRLGNGKKVQEVKSNVTDNESAKMTTSKGTIQGYNGIAAVDKKHQIIIDAQAFGEGQEHHTLQPMIESIKERSVTLTAKEHGSVKNTIITADTGFANEANMEYLYRNNLNAYIPDNQFRSRDPKFVDQKTKHGKRHQKPKKDRAKRVIPASEFNFDPVKLTCICPSGEMLSLIGLRDNECGNPKAFFHGRLLQCRHCKIKEQCMQNPESADHRKGSGRQVSFILNDKRKPNYTDWMKHRIDSDYGKYIYSHRMSVVEPVFANIGTQKRLNRFSLRGKIKVDCQWKLYCMVHNIEKLANYGNIPV